MEKTVVTLVDDDGTEFPVALPGIYTEGGRVGPDIAAALQIAAEQSRDDRNLKPNGALRFDRIEYLR